MCVKSISLKVNENECKGRRSRDRMVAGFTTTYAISPDPTKVVSSNPVHGVGVLDKTLCEKNVQ